MSGQSMTGSANDEATLPLKVWLALFSNVRQIEWLIRTNLRESFGSTLPRFDLLSQLYRVADGMTMSELSTRLMVSNSNVTGLIARLVAERLVSRVADPQDKRIQRVALTPKGRRVFETMIPANQAWVSAAMAGVPRDDLVELQALLQKLKVSVSGAVQMHKAGEVPGDQDGPPWAAP